MVMTLDPTTAVAVIVPSVTALVWLLRLEGRVNTNEFATNGLRKDVTYIRNRIDQAIGGHSHSRHDDSQGDE
jgi:hypothetical protein